MKHGAVRKIAEYNYQRMKEMLEKTAGALSDGQGEWSSVERVHCPMAILPLKDTENEVHQLLSELDKQEKA